MKNQLSYEKLELQLKQAKEELNLLQNNIDLSEHKHLKIIADYSKQGLVLCSKKGIILYANRAFLEIIGYTLDEIKTKSFNEITFDTDYEREKKAVQKIKNKQEKSCQIEKRYISKNGEIIWTSVTITCSFSIEGEVENYIAVINDIHYNSEIFTELEQAHHIVQNIATGIYVYKLEKASDDRSLRLIFANKASEELTGAKVEDITGKTIDEIFPNLRKKEIPELYAQIAKNGKQTEIKDFIYSDDKVIEQAYSIKIFALPGRCVGVSFENVTQRIKAEEQLQESEKQYKLLFTEMVNGIAVHEMIYDEANNPIDYRFIEINPAFERLTGLKADLIINKTVLEVMPQTEKYWIETYGKVVQTGEPIIFENYAQELDKYFEVVAYSPQNDYFAVIFSDVTVRKKTELALKESEARFDRITTNTGQFIYRMKLPEGIYEYASRACEQIMGFSAQEFYSNPKLIIKIIHPDWIDYLDREWSKLLNNEVTDTYEFKIIDKNGQERWIFQKNLLIKDKSGKAIAIEGIVSDITQRKEMEENLLKANENLEEMIYIASHDLQVPLVSIEGYASELLEAYKDKLDNEGKYCIQRLKSNAQRMHSLVLALLDISRLNTRKHEHKTISINELMKKINKDLSLSLEQKNVEIKCDKLPGIKGDKTRIETVFRNIIVNSLTYGAKKIEIGYDGTNFFVRDDGVGIPKDQLEKIFKPGERLKMFKSDGVGMGLTFCKKVIEQHKGKIWAESDGLGKGSTFFVNLEKSILRK